MPPDETTLRRNRPEGSLRGVGESGEEPGRIEAAVFDLDGVVTLTAKVHAAAWKELFDDFLRSRSDETGEGLEPFSDTDYRRYVDGRPRREGIRSFLSARGIELPAGDPSGSPGEATVWGLAQRKNTLFRQLLERHGVEVDAEAVRLARELSSRGVAVAVASSSKNTGHILRLAGLEGLFEAQVDGVESEKLGLEGKPAPDLFLACLERLGGIPPARSVVIEDSEAGVGAGRAGGFGLVLGVDRGAAAVALREHGADWVARDLARVTVERLEAFFRQRRHARPNALAHWDDLARRLEGRGLALFLDYDGTLTPIVERPEDAQLSEEMRSTLRRVGQAWPTTIVSGRGREDVEALVGLAELAFAGSHGFDISGPSGLRQEVDPELPASIAAAAEELREATSGIPGAQVEDKRYAVAVHYRRVAEDRVAEVEEAVDRCLAGHQGLRKSGGKKVFELRPARDWDKGKAVLWLLSTLGLDTDDVVPLYLGDDVTDEDAFEALEGRGVGILVEELPRPTAATHSLQDVEEVRELLERLAGHEGDSSPEDAR
jgi:trehalose-phosphatase